MEVVDVVIVPSASRSGAGLAASMSATDRRLLLLAAFVLRSVSDPRTFRSPGLVRGAGDKGS